MFPSPSVTKSYVVFFICENCRSTKNTKIKICKFRLPVLINLASCFSHRSAVRFPPESLWFKPVMWSWFTFWYLGKTSIIQLTVFTMSLHAGFIPTSLYSELASACTGKRWCFCRFSEHFIGFVYDNHMVICWENTAGSKSGKPTVSLDEPFWTNKGHTLMNDTFMLRVSEAIYICHSW